MIFTKTGLDFQIGAGLMQANTRRNAFRVLLVLHFVGLALLIGVRFADYVIENRTAHSSLQILAFGRDLTFAINRTLALPGFLTIASTGIAMTLLRYGRRPPIWVWIKVTLNILAFFVVSPFVAPALTATRKWAHWSADHNQLAPQYQQSASQAALFGSIIFVLFLANIPVAVWKPFLSVKPSRFGAVNTAKAKVGA